jgi:UDPglucose 6-dehydrogenase
MTKKILIVGYGFVGKAVHHSLTATEKAAANVQVHILDPMQGHDGTSSPFDTVFICVPTPSNPDGSCDDHLVVEYVERFSATTFNPLIIVRSTVPPTTIKNLLKINPGIVFMPEFLREKSWKEDSVNPHMILIGTLSDSSYQLTLNTIRKSAVQFNFRNIQRAHPVEASLFKYAANTFLATKVVFLHEMATWLNAVGDGAHFDALSILMQGDSRFGNTHFKVPGDHGYGYGGSCFPKDMRALAQEGNGNLSLIEAAIKANDKLQNKHL